MASAKLTLGGMYDFTNGDIFASLALPEGIDLDTFVASLLLNYGEMDLIYVDPDALKEMIKYWGMRHYHSFSKWIVAINTEYEPLNNYDRTEIHTGTEKKETDGTISNSSSNISSGSYTQTHSPNTESTHLRSAYNDSGLTAVEKQQNSGTDTTTINYSGNPRTDGTNKQTTDMDDVTTYNTKLRAYGNIGVTSSQQMLKMELDIGYWNLYDRMCDIFADEFLLRIYD